MLEKKKWYLPLLVVFVGIAQYAFVFVIGIGIYSTVHLQIQKGDGIYRTPEEGMRTKIARSYTGIERIEIEYAGTNSFDGSFPDVWFVIAKVWAASRSDGKALSKGYSNPGSFFLRVPEGWVHVPEGKFPEVIGLGSWIFGLSR